MSRMSGTHVEDELSDQGICEDIANSILNAFEIFRDAVRTAKVRGFPANIMIGPDAEGVPGNVSS